MPSTRLSASCRSAQPLSMIAPRRFATRQAAIGGALRACSQRGAHLADRGGLAAVGADEQHRVLDQRAVGRTAAERRVLQADAKVAAAPDGFGDQWANIDAEARSHLGSARRPI